MIAVMFSHSSQALLDQHSSLANWLRTIGLVATPTFLLLSGFVCGHMVTGERRPVAEVRGRLVDRGLFLLIVVHLLLGFTHAMWLGPSIALTGNFYITDAVGLGLISASLLGSRVPVRHCLAGGLTLLLVGWTCSFFLDLSPGAYRPLIRLLVGLPEVDDMDEGWIVPIIPYIGIFTLGFAGGIWFTQERARGITMHGFAVKCQLWSAYLIAAALLLKFGWLLAGSHAGVDSQYMWYQLTEPRQKMPPGPAYELFFGGAGLVLFGTIATLARSRLGRLPVSAFAVMGRTSLVAYVVQYWLISVPALAFQRKGDAAYWSMVFPAAVLGVAAFCWAWDRQGGNRLLTLGLRRILAR